MAGNRGTEVETGGSFEIDTDGPAVTRLQIQPQHPIRNDAQNPVSVTVTIGLDEAMKSGETPSLSYSLSGAGCVPVPIENLVEVDPSPLEGDQGGVVQAWQGSFMLPADAGLNGVEMLSFAYQGVDDLENISEEIFVDNLFQIYQGDLPALPVPTGLAAESLAGGKINLTWNAVEHAVEYQLYRKAPGDSDLSEYTRVPSPLEGGQGGVFLDEPATDGTYTYAVASVRQENTQETLSEMSASVDASADSTPPDPPTGISLQQVPEGMFFTWSGPGYAEEVTYTLYRGSLSDLSDLSPIPSVPVQGGGLLDPSPVQDRRFYAITATDKIGNESALSESVSINPGLLPVSNLLVRQQDADVPVISWNHPSPASIAGYNIYVTLSGVEGPAGQEVPLNTALLTAPSYIDTGYAGIERRYTIIAVDNDSAESMPRSITLPRIQLAIGSQQLAVGSQQLAVRIKRGVMNRLEYQVKNLSSTRIASARLNVEVEPYPHYSASFSLDPDESQTIPVVIGGYQDLPDLAQLTTTVEITCANGDVCGTGEKVEIVRSSEIEVGDGMLVLRVLNEEFTRGVTGTVRFTLENTGNEEIEVLTAAGSSVSPDITWYLQDQDGNVLSSANFRQTLGQYLVALSNGRTVARIPAGGIFESDPVTLMVPGNAPDTFQARVSITNIYYQYGKPEQVTMNGLSSTHQVSLIDTSYYGEVMEITPQTSQGDEDIQITVRAVERVSEQPMPDVPLNLVISVSGFERQYEIRTGGDGTFTFTFTPLAGESGLYSVRVMHPARLDRPVHGTFVITKVRISPGGYNINIPRNYEKTLSFKVTTGVGTELHNLQLLYNEADQPGGVFPEGIHVTLPGSMDVSAASTVSLPVTVWGDNSAAETGQFFLRIVSDEKDYGTLVMNTQFYEPPPQPDLFVTPGYVEAGVAYDETAAEIVTLENRGAADLFDVSLTLLSNPNWISLNSPASIAAIPVGEQREVRILFSPTAAVPEGQHAVGTLRIESPEVPPVEIGLYATVTQSGEGKALFKVADIYTGTLDEQQQIIQGVAGARIKIQNEIVTSITQTGYTDSTGEALFEGLPSGRYKYRITAENHQEAAGRIWIKPGLTTTQEEFLEYNLMTVEWEVREITIEDRYEIVLKATYKTDVPAPVVVVEPISVSLPEMQAGDVFQGEFTLTNHGLVPPITSGSCCQRMTSISTMKCWAGCRTI